MPPSNLRAIPLQFGRSFRSTTQPRARQNLSAKGRSEPIPKRRAPPSLNRSGLANAKQRLSKTLQDEISVNYFEEDAGPNPKRRRMEFDMDKEEETQLKEQIKELEKDLEGLQMEKQIPESMARLYMTDEERGIARVAFEKELERLQPTTTKVKLGDIEGQLMRLEDIHIEPHQIHANEIIPRQSQILLNRLNEALDYAKLNSVNDTHRRDVSRWYSHCKHKVRSFLNMIPDEGWDLLWKVQSQETASNPNRSSHLKTLAEDMLAVGRPLNQEQMLAQLEGIFLEGKHDEAIKQWEDKMLETKGSKTDLMELGIRIFSRQDNLERAEQILHDLLASEAMFEPRVIIALIHAYNRMRTPEGHLRAMTLYTQMRALLGTRITIKDYDELSFGFLESDRADLALAVFRDMISSGEAGNESLWERTLHNFKKLVPAFDKPEKINEVSLTTLTYLPIRFQNKYFYASWLKRLIGMNEVDAAAKVIELMYERGISPDAKHVNGIIGAWLRQGDGSAREKAESMAWAMIQERLNFVARRDSLSRIRRKEANEMKATTPIAKAGIKIPTFMARPVPAATVETFSVLVQHYVRRSKHDHVRHLRDLLLDAQIPMNSYIMNHLLFGVLRTGTPQDVWSRYQVFTRSVIPDIETFDCLWECMKFQVDTSRHYGAGREGFPTPRELFAIMMNWFQTLSKHAQRNALTDLDKDTYRDIIRCFCISKDLEGTFVAMQTMRETFEVFPDPETGRMLLLQISRLNAPIPHSPLQKKAIVRSAEAKANVANSSLALDGIAARRRAVLDQNGTPFMELNKFQQQEENHRTMLELVYLVLRKRLGPHEGVVSNLERAAKEMGVRILDLDDIMAPIQTND